MAKACCSLPTLLHAPLSPQLLLLVPYSSTGGTLAAAREEYDREMIQAARKLKSNHSRHFRVFCLENITVPAKAFGKDEVHMIRSQNAFRQPQLPPAVDKIEELCAAVRSYLEQSPAHVAVLLAHPRTLPFLLVCVQHVCELLPPARQALLPRTYLDYCDALVSQGPGPAFRECMSSRALHSFLRHWHRTRTAEHITPALVSSSSGACTGSGSRSQEGSSERTAAPHPQTRPQQHTHAHAHAHAQPQHAFSSAGMVLYGITLFGLPQIRASGGTCHLSVMVVAEQGIVYSSPVSAFAQSQAGAHFATHVRMVGDSFVKLYQRSSTDQSNILLLTFAFHPRFSSYPDRRCLRVSHADFDLDDRKLFPPSFAIELDFDAPVSGPLPPLTPPASASAAAPNQRLGTGASVSGGVGGGVGAVASATTRTSLLPSSAPPPTTAAAAREATATAPTEREGDRFAGLRPLSNTASGPAVPQPEGDTALLMLMQALLGLSFPRNNPAPLELVRMLPVVRVTASSSMATEECAICREQFQADESVRWLPCMHFYHAPCIDPWFELQDHCPVCKSRLSPETMQLMG